MKRYQLLFIAFAVLGLTSCEDELKQDASLLVNVTQNENVSINGDTVVVKKGEPVIFNFTGNPDNITFYSGEIGSRYEYRDRGQVNPEDIQSSKLTFSVWAQYGNATTAANALKIYISDAFTGLAKNNFKADSVLVESFNWNNLVDPTLLPQKPGTASSAASFEIDLAPYLGKRFAIAICYKPQDNSAAQPRMNFDNMKIVNVMKDGSTSTLYAGNFGLTPVNMMSHYNLADQTGLQTNRDYGTVTNNTSGIWNLTNAGKGSFFIHSSNAGSVLKYSWLVSDLIMANATSPDAGQAIKNIAQRLDSYAYTYNNVGTYKATFVATNSNYKYESRVLKEINIKVVE